MSKKPDDKANLASPNGKNQKEAPAKEDKPSAKKAGGKGDDPKNSAKGKGPVKPEPVPEKKKAPYELIQVDTNEFYQRYNKFLEEDKENKKKQAEYLKTYLENTGLKMAFRVIAAEAISKNMRPDEVLAYAAERLKELGKEIEKISIVTSTSNNPSLNQTKGGSTTTVPSGNATAKSTANGKK